MIPSVFRSLAALAQMFLMQGRTRLIDDEIKAFAEKGGKQVRRRGGGGGSLLAAP